MKKKKENNKIACALTVRIGMHAATVLNHRGADLSGRPYLEATLSYQLFGRIAGRYRQKKIYIHKITINTKF